MQSHRITNAVFVPIDVGKNLHCYGAYQGPQLTVLVAPQEVRSYRPGYEEFKTWLTHQLITHHPTPIIVGLEPTGVYHEAWAAALQRDFGSAIQVRLVNTFRTRQKRKQLQNRAERKTDPIDVEALAHCLQDGVGHPYATPSAEVQALTLWCRRHYRLQKDRQRALHRLSSQMDRLWPGAFVNVPAFRKAHPDITPPEPLVATQPFDRQLGQAILRTDPNPYTWRAQSWQQIRDTLRAAGRRCGPKTAQKVARVAQQALLPAPDRAQLLAEMVRAEFQRFELLLAEMATLRQQAETLVQGTPGAVVATVPGLSLWLAAQYVGLVGDPGRFQTADQVWALVGFDIVQDHSGDRRRRGHLTKQGQSYGRAVLFQMGFAASRRCPAIRRAKQRARRRGKGHAGAVIHAAHKTNRICFHLYQHGIPFDPDKVQ
jgi:transposase